MALLGAIIRKTLALVQRSESIICAVGLVATTLLIFAQVINRYWLHLRIMILGDMALYCFIFFMFIAAALATWQENHVSVDILRERVFHSRPKALATHRLVLTLMSMVILCTFLPQAGKFLLRAVQYPEYGTLVHWFNTSWLMETFVICMVLVLVHLIVIGVRDTKAFMNERNTEDGGHN